MPSLVVFNQVSLDGFIADANGDMSWAHKQDTEWNDFVAGNASGESRMLFGRFTYEMMAGWWPTPQARAAMPAVAERMNSSPKVVFSRSLKAATWNNTRLVATDMAGEVRRLKREAGPDMVIMGSGSIVAQLADEGLVDQFMIVVNPVVLGGGKPMFSAASKRLSFKQTGTRAFGNGNVLLNYQPMV